MSDTPLILKALTAEMDLAFQGPRLRIDTFPFKIGRECRARRSHSPPPGIAERRTGRARPNNDLYIRETGNRVFVSREHLLIETREDGFYLVDLFSSCGTIVEAIYVGGDHKGGEARLRNHDVVIIGTANSPYVFKVLTA